MRELLGKGASVHDINTYNATALHYAASNGHAAVHAHTNTHTHTHMYMYMYVCMYTCVCVCACVFVRAIRRS